MPFSQHPAIGPGQRNPHRAAVLQLERHIGSNQFGGNCRSTFKSNGAFDAVKTGDRQPGAVHHSLVASDSIPHLPDDAFSDKVPHTGARLDELECSSGHGTL